MTEKLLIERRSCCGFLWEEYAYPINNIESALKDLRFLRREESKLKYAGELRLVRITKEIIDE